VDSRESNAGVGRRIAVRPIDHDAFERKPVSKVEPFKQVLRGVESISFSEGPFLMVREHLMVKRDAVRCNPYRLHPVYYCFTEHTLLAPVRFPGPRAQADCVPALWHPFRCRPYRLAFLPRQHQGSELRLEESHEVGRTRRCTEPGLYALVAVVTH